MKNKLFILMLSVLFVIGLCSCGNSSDANNKTEIESLTISNANIVMSVGDSSIIDVAVTPKEADKSTIKWSSSDNNVATVDNGNITAIAAGNTTITAMTDSGVKAMCNVKVKGIEVSSVKLNRGSITIKKNKSFKLNATVYPENASKKSVRWESSDNSIAVVNSNGRVKGVKKGTVSINCIASNGKSASCIVRVKKDYTPVKYTPSPDPWPIRDDSQIFPYSSSEKLTDYEVSYLSSDAVQEAINEIYARNGYIFKNKNIQSYFESKYWYVPRSSFSTSDFNSIENYNIGLLKKYK